MRTILTQCVVAHRLGEQGLDPIQVKEWTRRVDLKTIKLVKGKERRGGFGAEFLSSFVFAMMLYMVIIGYGIMVMRGVMEEKSTRMVEVLLSSVSPMQMMVGKILGIGAASLTQVAVWLGVAVLFSTSGSALIGRKMPFSLEPETLIFFGLFFILGYFLYATFYAMIGAICDTEQDAQQIQMIVILPLMIPLFLIIFIANNPSATASVVLSMIPLFLPVLMFVRINVLVPPAIEIFGSVVILLATIAGVMWCTARIYRIGILMKGKRATLRELMRWVRYGQ
jgi:ABC-2 type transport system permease protein